MRIIEKENFPYKFDADACKTCGGNCCIGESGYIWVTPEEIKNIASFLGFEEKEFIKKCLIKVGYKYSIKERPYEGGFACIFFEKGCKIYPVRPKQCRTFPFWDYFKDRIDELKKECPGIIEVKNEK
ncbi:MAG: YkgJ family cysteine cluster protein [Nautiliaceae bacterium]